MENGADGLVFGFLHEDGTIDEARTKEMVSIASGLPCVFHRALDVVPDWRRALETLVRLGVTRVLTSGQESDVFFALDTIREMIEFAAGPSRSCPGRASPWKTYRRWWTPPAAPRCTWPGTRPCPTPR